MIAMKNDIIAYFWINMPKPNSVMTAADNDANV